MSAAVTFGTSHKSTVKQHSNTATTQHAATRESCTLPLSLVLTPPLSHSTMTDYYGHNTSSNNTQGHSSFSQNNTRAHNDAGKIFVGGLSWQTTEESLRWHFEQYGPVASVEVMRDRKTGDPRGFAFVVFVDAATVDAVMEAGSHEVNHKVVDVKRAQARGVAPPSIHRSMNEGSGGVTGVANVNSAGGGMSAGGVGSQTGSSGNYGVGGVAAHVQSASTAANSSSGGGAAYSQFRPQESDELSPEQMGNKVFVGGIPPHMDKDGLKELFEQFGTVVDSIVMMDTVTQRSRCFGFVTFANGSNGAQYAIEAQPLSVQGRHVEVKLATPRADQRRVPPAGPKNVGLRAGVFHQTGPYAGLAVAYGRSGWKAGYGSKAFGKAGWAVQGWDSGGDAPEESGFSFAMLPTYMYAREGEYEEAEATAMSTAAAVIEDDTSMNEPHAKRVRH
jgi:RNA-binding protein Musashi